MSQMFRDQSRELRKKAQQELIGNRVEAGKAFINEAAALEQAEELLARKDDKEVRAEADEPDGAARRDRRARRAERHLSPPVTAHGSLAQ